MFGRGRPGPSRRFGKGDLKYVFLDMLAEQPRHGYDLIRALEARCAGGYTASPGTVYPILQMLEDMGHVTVAEQDGRKIYTVTTAGHAFLDERREQVQGIWERASQGHGGPHDMHQWMAMMHELRELGMRFARGRPGELSPERLTRIHAVLVKARHEIEGILDGPA